MPSQTLSLAFLATTLSSVVAQQSTILSIPFFGYDNASFYGSVIGAASSTTTLSIACPPGEQGGDECGLFPMQTLTIGPSTYNMYMAEGTDFTGTQMCNTQGTTEAVCTESASGVSANFPGVSTQTYSGNDNSTGVTVYPVTVTGGVNLLAGGGGSGSGSSSGPASASASATSSGSGSASSSTASHSGAGSSSKSAAASGSSSAAAASSSSAGVVGAASPGQLMSLILAVLGGLQYLL